MQWGLLYLRLRRIYLRIKHSPDRYTYSDLAMTLVRDDEADTHELFQTDAAKAYVGQEQHLRDARTRGREAELTSPA